MLDLTKPLMIEGVGPVRLLTSEGRTPGYPVVVERESGETRRFSVNGESYLLPGRLINAPEPPLVRWMVVYADCGVSGNFLDERWAWDNAARNFGSRLFRIEIGEQPKIEEVK